MPIYFEFVGNNAVPPLLKLAEETIPSVARDCSEADGSFLADSESAVLQGFNASGRRYNTGPGAMNIRPILKWNNDGDHRVHVCAFPRYVWSS